MAGHSLLLALAEGTHSYSQITLYDAPAFCPPCSLNSTAIVAPRGVSAGHSDLGDLLLAGFKTFSDHIVKHSPTGVIRIPQFTATKTKLDQFRTRYPNSALSLKTGELTLMEEHLVAHEDAFEITPDRYLAWIRSHVQNKLNLEIKTEFFKDSDVDAEIVFCGGVANKFWNKDLKSKSVQGAYLEFNEIDLDKSSFSLTLDGHNLIYQHIEKTLLIGSSTHETHHYLAPKSELRSIHQFITDAVDIAIPDFSEGIIKTGLREKAPKRLPYILKNANQTFIGGFYKNGFSLSLEMSNRWLKSLSPHS